MSKFSLFLFFYLFSYHPLPIFSLYSLLWFDDFNSSTLDASSWNIEEGDQYYNNETQAYTTNNYNITNGILNLISKVESWGTKNYTSARINTQHKKDFTYGKFEARMKMPQGQGYWPAFWMLPSDYDNWPVHGEIDIMEAIGSKIFQVSGTCNMGEEGLSINEDAGYSYDFTMNFSYADDFHIYAVEWTKGRLNWTIDGNEYFSAVPADTKPYWPFDEGNKFYIILNLAVGGNLPGYVDNTTPFPSLFQIDYVRVYQIVNDTSNNTVNETNNSKYGKIIKNRKFIMILCIFIILICNT